MAPPALSHADGEPSAAELWEAYPLQPTGSDATSGGARADGAAATSQDGAGDSRLMLQLALLFGAFYTMLLCGWFSVTRGVVSLGAGRGAWTAAVANARPRTQRRSVPRGAGSSRAAADAVWTCAIAWRAGRMRSRFRAVMAAPDRRRCRVVAQSRSLRWAPRRGGTPPTAEVVSAVDALVASLLDAGWEPVESGGSWSARRFEWRREGEPPERLMVGPPAGRRRRP